MNEEINDVGYMNGGLFGSFCFTSFRQSTCDHRLCSCHPPWLSEFIHMCVAARVCSIAGHMMKTLNIRSQSFRDPAHKDWNIVKVGVTGANLWTEVAKLVFLVRKEPCHF